MKNIEVQPMPENMSWKTRLDRLSRGEKVKPRSWDESARRYEKITNKAEHESPSNLTLKLKRIYLEKLRKIATREAYIDEVIKAYPQSKRIISEFANYGVEAESFLIEILEYGGLGFKEEKTANYDKPIKTITEITRDFEKRGSVNISDIEILLNKKCAIHAGEFEENKIILNLLTKIGTERAVDFVLDIARDPGTFYKYHKEILSLAKKHFDYTINKLTFIFSNKAESGIPRMMEVLLLTDMLGSEESRKRLDELIIKNKDTEKVVNSLKYTRSFITPNDNKEAILNLQKFYQENIKFEEYKVNELMNEREIKLLESLISKKEKALEMGCGTGRLITELAKDGYDLSGYDFTKRHVEITKEAIEKTGQKVKVFQGDWHSNAIKDESLDAVYSLGRNILHDYSIVDQVQLFREANRILKKGGKFIFDIPNREKGGYKKMVDEYASEMEKRGIRNFRYGSIYDSPDGQHFATRYAYSHEDIEKLARLTGFKIAKVEKLPLETGEDDENWYYVLEKI